MFTAKCFRDGYITSGFFSGSIHGAAKHANIISVKTLAKNHEGKLSWLVEGLEWIAQYINSTKPTNITSVINFSSGIVDRDELNFLEACLQDIPAIVVAAAGNDNADACNVVPARFRDVITVSAIDKDDELFYLDEKRGANTGPCVDILAPGQDLLSAVNYNNYGEKSHIGTSMAAGLVSGVVAQHLENLGTQVSGYEIKRVLQNAAARLDIWSSHTTNLLVQSSCDYETPLYDMSLLSDEGICFPTINFTATWKQKWPPKSKESNPREYIGTFLIIGAGCTISVIILLITDICYRRKLNNNREDQEAGNTERSFTRI